MLTLCQGINITANILRQLDGAVLDDYFYRHGASSETFLAIYGKCLEGVAQTDAIFSHLLLPLCGTLSRCSTT